MSGRLPSAWRRPARWTKACAASTQSSTKCARSFEAAQAEFQAIPGAGRTGAGSRRACATRSTASAPLMRRRAPSMTGWSARRRPGPNGCKALRPSATQWGERAKRATEQIEHLTTRAAGNPRGHCRTCRHAADSGRQAPHADEPAAGGGNRAQGRGRCPGRGRERGARRRPGFARGAGTGVHIARGSCALGSPA